MALYINGVKTLDGAVAGGDQPFTDVGDMTFHAGSIIRSGATNGNTLLLAANDTTFITFTTGATDVCTLDNITLKGTLLADGTVTIPAVTLGGAIAGGDQAFTNVGDMTFAAGSILASGSTNGNTLLLKANDTTFITLTTGATDVCTLAGITASGTWLSSSWGIPAGTLQGTITLNGQSFDAGANNALFTGTASPSYLTLQATTDDASGAFFRTNHISATPAASDQIGAWLASGMSDGTPQVAVTYGTIYFNITSPTKGAETGDLELYLRNSGAANSAFKISGPGLVWADVGFNADEYYQVAGTQVVGARVIDARCDDVANSGDATTDGLIDALRDAMIAHGLVAAA